MSASVSCCHKPKIDAARLLAKAGIDASENEAANRLQRLLLEELHHRVKNTLATVIAITSQSLRTADSLEHGRLAVESRLVALGRAHDLLLQANWSSTKNCPTSFTPQSHPSMTARTCHGLLCKKPPSRSVPARSCR